MHLLFKQRAARRENDNCVRLKLAKNTCVAPGAALHRVYDRTWSHSGPTCVWKRLCTLQLQITSWVCTYWLIDWLIDWLTAVREQWWRAVKVIVLIITSPASVQLTDSFSAVNLDWNLKSHISAGRYWPEQKDHNVWVQ